MRCLLLLPILSNALHDTPVVTSQSMLAASSRLKSEVDGTQIQNDLVKRAVGNGFTYFELDGSAQTMTYHKDKTEALTPYVKNILNAPDASTDLIRIVLAAAEYVTDGAGQMWSHHTMSYSVQGTSVQGGTGFAQFVVASTPSRPDMRTLFMFNLKSAYALAPDIIYLRSCSSHSGFLGIGSSSECHEVPKAIPHTLDLVSLHVLDDYLTAVGLKMLAPSIPPPSTSQVTGLIPSPVQAVPPEFAPVIDALRKRLPLDKQALSCSRCSEKVRELVTHGFQKFKSSMSGNQMTHLPHAAAQKVIAYKVSSFGPKVVEVLESMLNTSTPVVYSTLSCDDAGNCHYIFVCGRTATGSTDLMVVQAAATFVLAPHLVVVRETSINANGTNVTQDKIHKVPAKVTQADLDAVLAFFEVEVVNTLDSPGRIADIAFVADPFPVPPPSSSALLTLHATTPAPTPAPGTRPSPSMTNNSQPVPEWQKLLQTIAKDAGLANNIANDIKQITGAATGGATAAAAIGGIGGASALGWVGGVLGGIAAIGELFHHSSSHTSQIVGELQNAGFKHFAMESEGPIQLKNVPLHHIEDGKDILPAKTFISKLLDDYMDDMPDDKIKGEIKEFVPMLLEGWMDSSMMFPMHSWLYNEKNGGNMRNVKLFINVNTSAPVPGGGMPGVVTAFFYSVKMSLTLADRLLIYRITDSHSDFFSSSSSSRDEIRHLPRDITMDDILAIEAFLNVIMTEDMAMNLNMCSIISSRCQLPPTQPNNTKLANFMAGLPTSLHQFQQYVVV